MTDMASSQWFFLSFCGHACPGRHVVTSGQGRRFCLRRLW